MAVPANGGRPRPRLGESRLERSQLVAVGGEAGVGQSRLFHEFIHSHHVLAGAWRVLEARSVSYGKATPFLPRAELRRGYFRIDDRDDRRTVRAKVTESRVQPLVLLFEDLHWIDSETQAGRPEEARRALADIYGSFTEGLDTQDLRAAKALRDELESD